MNSSKLPIGPEYPWLAPLSGFSDLAFRILCRKLGCSVAFTEMVSAKGIIHRSIGCQKILRICAEDSPLVVQVFGSEPEVVREAISILKHNGFVYFDLNAGCPVKKVVKTGSGAALLKDVTKLFKILEEMVRVAGEKMVGVKIRSGWYAKDKTFLEVGKRAEDIGIGWISFHPRSAVQKFSGQADWNQLKELQENTSVPVVGSGDIFSVGDAKRCIQTTGIKGVMFARGALSNPLVFEEFVNGKTDKSIVDVIKMHVYTIKRYLKQDYNIKKIRGVIARYLKGFHYASLWRKKAMEIESWEDVEDFLKKLSEKVKYGKNNKS